MQAGELTVEDSKAPMPDGPPDRPLGPLCFQIRISHPHTGQVEVVLWPRLAIQNELPFPVEFCLEQDPGLTGGQHATAYLLHVPTVLLLQRQPQCEGTKASASEHAGLIKSGESSMLALPLQTQRPSGLQLRWAGSHERLTGWSERLGSTQVGA